MEFIYFFLLINLCLDKYAAVYENLSDEEMESLVHAAAGIANYFLIFKEKF